MGKILEGLFGENSPSKKVIRALIKKRKKSKTVCYVLLTCTEPKEDGSMEVDMQFEGKKWLAAYLIKSAQGLLEEK